MSRVVSSLVALGILLVPSLGGAVDGVREINASNVSGGPGPLYMITLPGSYRLTSDLSVPAGRIGISIIADDVTLDLNGFTLRGSGGVGTDIGIAAGARTNVEIRNGTVRDIPGSGIFAAGASGIRVIDVRVLNVDDNGINLEAGGGAPPLGQHLVRGCTVIGSGSEGVRVLGAGGLAEGNTIRDSTLQGLTINAGSGYGGNVITGNNGGGAQVGGGGVAVACNLIGIATVCP